MMTKILVVDNDLFMLEFLKDILSKAGHEMLTAEGGLSALDILKTYTPDIMFVDLVMPNIDGKKLCKIIRKMPKLKNIYIVILSAIAAEKEIDIAELGANACIAKGPMKEMAERILSVLDQTDLASDQCLSGKIIGVESIYPRIITEELLSAKRHFEVILEKMSEGILEINSDGRIIYANPFSISLISKSEEEILGFKFTDLFDNDDHQRVDDLIETLEDKPKVITEGNPVRLKGYQVTLKILPINEDGFTAIIILNDVTERKRAEAEREKLIFELKDALAEVKALSGLLPICSSCKKIRNDDGYWEKIERYISERSNATFTHGICPDCTKKLYPNLQINEDK
jgi:PAS domain S-box-containing protein